MAFSGTRGQYLSVTGIEPAGTRMHAQGPPGVTLCPFVALHSGVVTATKGDRIRHARELRRETREQVAAATGVNTKTIARIERGEVANSASATVLERYLGLTPAEPPTTTGENLDQKTVDYVLDNVSFLELLAAVARRYARATDTPHTPDPGRGSGHYKVFTEDVPAPDQPTGRQTDVGKSGKAP